MFAMIIFFDFITHMSDMNWTAKSHDISVIKFCISYICNILALSSVAMLFRFMLTFWYLHICNLRHVLDCKVPCLPNLV